MISSILNSICRDGKKQRFKAFLWRSLVKIRNKRPRRAIMRVLSRSYYNVSTRLKLVSKRIGGAVYKIPRFYSDPYNLSRTVRNVSSNLKSRPEKKLSDKIAQELIDNSDKVGTTYRTATAVHKAVKKFTVKGRTKKNKEPK